MIGKRADGVWIAKTHAQPHAGILEHPAIVIPHVYRIAKEGLVNRNAVPGYQFSMIQSSTVPCFTTMFGIGEFGSNCRLPVAGTDHERDYPQGLDRAAQARQ